jgi:hypothetical protein
MQPPWPTAVARWLPTAVGLLQLLSATAVGHGICPTAVAHNSWTRKRCGPQRLVVKTDNFSISRIILQNYLKYIYKFLYILLVLVSPIIMGKLKEVVKISKLSPSRSAITSVHYALLLEYVLN